ncbi:hypothetical protein [Streptomyces sp. MMBL 11-1]|uniref:hypothetical protein n=1 Tax=Streptomyces sp. MMBL 11-1 TaxID=3026420 RepID=UPI00235FD253|nr:hypothetical protein [Streptomyces sp. MMBL 11-1]
MKLEPGDMLLALARDLSETRTTLSAGLEDLAGRLEAVEGAEYGDAIAGLRKVLGDVTEAVQKLQAKAEEEEPEGPGTAPDWTNLDKEQCRELWDWLNTWCSKVLLPVYAPDAWRPCWYRHTELKFQLTWLCAYWHWAYEKTAPPTRAAEWHVRWWPAVLTFMKKELAECGYVDPEKLRDPLHVIPADDSLDDFADSGLLEWMDRDIERRPDPEKKRSKKDPAD